MRGLEKILIGPLGLVIFVALYPLYHSFPWLRVLVLPLACWTMSIALVLLRWLLRSDSSAMTDTAWGLAAVGAGFLYFGLAWKIWHSIGVLVLALPSCSARPCSIRAFILASSPSSTLA